MAETVVGTAKLAAPPEKERITAADVFALIRKKFPLPEYAVFAEVPDATGFQASRSVDAMVMSLWPSRGLELSGMEIKVSRADWLREKKNPRKADGMFRRCDRWYLVVSDPAIVHPGELPETWGLLAVKGGRLNTVVKAPLNQPEPLDRPFLAALLRRAAEGSAAEAELRQAQADARAEGLAEGQRQAVGQREQELLQRELTALRNNVAAFERESGVRIDGYQGAQLGKAVATVLEAERYQLRLLRLQAEVARVHELFQGLELAEPSHA